MADFLWLYVGVIAIVLLLRWIIPGKGVLGELSVARILDRLPKEYKTINDLLIRVNGHTSQIDHIVVSPYGIFVIETKNYTGIISGGEHSGKWTKNMFGNKYELYNPIFQNETHVKAIRRILNDEGDMSIIPIVAFSNNCTLRIKLESAMVVYFRQLKRTILAYRERYFTDAEVKTIYKELAAANIVDKQERKAHVYQAKSRKMISDEKISRGICPKCGGSLVLRKGQYGRFYGCSNYPRCKYTLNI